MSTSRNGELLLVSRIYCSSKESVIKQNIWAVKSLFFFTDLYCINLENGLDPAKVKIVPGTLFLLREIDYRQYFYCILSMRCLGHGRPSKSLQQCFEVNKDWCIPNLSQLRTEPCVDEDKTSFTRVINAQKQRFTRWKSL